MGSNWEKGDRTVPTPAAKYLTIAEAADILRLSTWAVYKLAQRDDFPAYKPEGIGTWRIDASELDAWVKAGRPADEQGAA